MYQGYGYIMHSAKGQTWKKHKYIRKEGNRYIYVENKDKTSAREKFNMLANGTDATEERLKKEIDEYNRLSEFLERVSKSSSTLFIKENSRNVAELRNELKRLDMQIARTNMQLNAQRYLGENGLGRTPHGTHIHEIENKRKK